MDHENLASKTVFAPPELSKLSSTMSSINPSSTDTSTDNALKSVSPSDLPMQDLRQSITKGMQIISDIEQTRADGIVFKFELDLMYEVNHVYTMAWDFHDSPI